MFDVIRMGASAAGDYEIKRSLRFNSADDAYLSRTPSSESNRRTWTWSGWLKRSNIGAVHDLFAAYDGSSAYNIIRIGSNDQLNFQTNSAAIKLTNAKLRDPSAWYHIVVAIDTTSGTAADRVIIYINGVRQTLATDNTVTQNTDYFFNTTNAHTIGAYANGTSYHLDGYMTEINFVDGTALTPTSFGETHEDTGAWVPKKYTGAHGTNGFYLNFSDNSNTTSVTLGNDTSASNNDWLPNNFSVSDSLIDTPTNNFCTLNPLNEDYASNGAFSEGNLKYDSTSTNHRNTAGTIGMKSGKWYFEFCNPTLTDGNKAIWGGIVASDADLTAQRTTGMWHVGASNGTFLVRDGTATDFGSAISAGTIIQAAVDMDNDKLWIGVNNTWYGSSGSDTDGNPSTGANPTDTIAAADIPDGYLYPSLGGYDLEMKFNAGQDSSFSGTKTAQNNKDSGGIGDFYYAPPTGFKALCTKNLPEPTIKNGTDYFNTVLYTGNDSSDLNSITGVGFQPNLVWGKSRNDTIDHVLFDSVRGDDKQLSANNSSAEVTRSNPAYRFISDGFQVATAGNLNNPVNYAAWCWKESVTAGFDILIYDGNDNADRDIEHSLNAVPDLWMVKSRTNAQDWMVGVRTLGVGGYIQLSSNGGFYTGTGADIPWSNEIPSSDHFTVGENGDGWATNEAGESYVAYLWASVEGYSKVGTFVGNGNADGAFIYLGFKPAFFMWKVTNESGGWGLIDNTRDPYNVAGKQLFPHAADGEASWTICDFLSNGVKMRNTYGDTNGSSDTMVYLAFAETPFKYANAR